MNANYKSSSCIEKRHLLLIYICMQLLSVSCTEDMGENKSLHVSIAACVVVIRAENSHVLFL